jgi:hypothetical protein
VRTRNKQFTWNGLGAPKPLNWYLELRMIPRSNFLQQKTPLPLNQGTEEWAWTGSYVWTDAEVPAGLLFGHRVAKRGDFEWTLNQAHFIGSSGYSWGFFIGPRWGQTAEGLRIGPAGGRGGALE